MTTLDQILAATRERVERSKEQAQVRPLEKAAAAHTPRGFRKRLAAMSQIGPGGYRGVEKSFSIKGDDSRNVSRGNAGQPACSWRSIRVVRAYR